MLPKAFPHELLQRSASERLAYFRSYTVAHPLVKAVSDTLWQAIQEPGGASLIFVVGPTGVGKTTLRLRIEQELKQRFRVDDEPNLGRIPVIGFEAAAPDSGNFSWKDYYRRALRALEDPFIDHTRDYPKSDSRRRDSDWIVLPRGCNPELRQVLEHALRHRRPAAVLIDEAQHFTKMASGRRLTDQLDCLKSMASLTGCVHVLIGTYELLPCRNLSAQLSRRSIDIHFRRYRADDPDDVAAFQRVLFSFQRHLPLPQEPELWQEWEFCYARSMGCIGILKDWFTRALAQVLEQGAPTLTRANLEHYAWSLNQCEKMAQDTLEGESAFMENPGSANRLRERLGLRVMVDAETTKPVTVAPSRGRSQRVGSRRPARDEVGIHQAG